MSLVIRTLGLKPVHDEPLQTILRVIIFLEVRHHRDEIPLCRDIHHLGIGSSFFLEKELLFLGIAS